MHPAVTTPEQPPAEPEARVLEHVARLKVDGTGLFEYESWTNIFTDIAVGLVGYLAWSQQWFAIGAGLAVVMLGAQIGRVRAGGRHVFPVAAVFAAPLWVAERALCAWLAVAKIAACTCGMPPTARC